MSYRKAHGKAAKGGQTLVWETPPIDELAAPAAPAVDLKAGRDRKGRIVSSEAAREMARLRHAKPDFVRDEVTCDPKFAPFDRKRRELVRRRVAELHSTFGGVSAGVGAILRAWGWAVAFGEFLAARAAETGDPKLMDQSCAQLARASVELAKAHDLASKEAAKRPQASPHAALEAAFGGSGK